MDVSLHIARFAWPNAPSSIAPTLGSMAEIAEQAGVASVSLMDHYFQMEMLGPDAPSEPMLEGYTTLGYLAARTRRVRLGLLVTGITYRHPGLLAKIVTTLDVLSGGRAELGIGAAWYEREHAALGVPFPPLAERFERQGVQGLDFTEIKGAPYFRDRARHRCCIRDTCDAYAPCSLAHAHTELRLQRARLDADLPPCDTLHK